MRHTADRPDLAPCNTLHFRPEQALVGAATGIDQTTFHRVVETVAGENVQLTDGIGRHKFMPTMRDLSIQRCYQLTQPVRPPPNTHTLSFFRTEKQLTDRRRRRSTTFVARPTTAARDVGTQKVKMILKEPHGRAA